MQETVNQDEIETSFGLLVISTEVRHNEVAPMLAPGVGDVVGIDIDSKVLGVREKGGIDPRAAANIQNSAGSGDGVVGQKGLQLGRSKRRLPRAVDYGLLQKVVEHAHGISEVLRVQNSCGGTSPSQPVFAIFVFHHVGWGKRSGSCGTCVQIVKQDPHCGEKSPHRRQQRLGNSRKLDATVYLSGNV